MDKLVVYCANLVYLERMVITHISDQVSHVVPLLIDHHIILQAESSKQACHCAIVAAISICGLSIEFFRFVVLYKQAFLVIVKLTQELFAHLKALPHPMLC